MPVIERAAAIAYEYKHGEPPPTDSPHGPIGPAWDCWKTAEAILALADDAGAVEALREVERLLDHADLRAIPDVMNALDAARAITGAVMRTYTNADMNRAIVMVETAKQNHPVGWGALGVVGFHPIETVVEYAFLNADLHAERMASEDVRIVYSAGWLNGLMIGGALGQDEDAAADP